MIKNVLIVSLLVICNFTCIKFALEYMYLAARLECLELANLEFNEPETEPQNTMLLGVIQR
ncbi:MAG: hypothetical protein JWM30_2 [Burkholderia sp.]|nr:hypothetical protein [Burkholderia sp.]